MDSAEAALEVLAMSFGSKGSYKLARLSFSICDKSQIAPDLRVCGWVLDYFHGTTCSIATTQRAISRA